MAARDGGNLRGKNEDHCDGGREDRGGSYGVGRGRDRVHESLDRIVPRVPQIELSCDASVLGMGGHDLKRV